MSNCNVKRNNGYDLLRILATIAVVLIHVNAMFFSKRIGENTWQTNYIVENIINIVTRFSVPAFMMISGAFALSNPQNADIKRFYCKSIYKIYVPLVLPVLFLMMVSVAGGASIVSVIKLLLVGDYYNLWFLYTLFFLYLLVPFMVRLKNAISLRAYRISGVVFLLLTCATQGFSEYNVPYAMGLVFSYLAYFVMGNILYEWLNTLGRERKPWYIHPIILLTGMILLYAATFLIRQWGYHKYEFNPFTCFFSPTIAAASILMFILFGRINIKVNLYGIASRTFYVYVFHTAVFIFVFRYLGTYLPSNELLSIAAVSAITIVVSFLVALIYELVWKGIEKIFSLKKKWCAMRIWS